MNIIVETGEGVSGANSYNSLADIKSYADARGLALPCEEDKLKPLSFRSMDIMKTYSSRLKGEKVSSTQSLDWPRKYVEIDCVEIAEDEVPSEAKEAQIHLMVALHAGFDPMQIIKVEPYVTEEMLGPMKIKYSKPERFDGPAYEAPRIPIFESLMSKLLEDEGSTFSFVKV